MFACFKVPQKGEYSQVEIDHLFTSLVLPDGLLVLPSCTYCLSVYGASEPDLNIIQHFCVGFPHTLSSLAIILNLFICKREPSVCHVVYIRKREDPGNECLCAEAITLLGCCHLANFDLFSRCD